MEEEVKGAYMAKSEHKCKDNEHIGRLAVQYDFFDWQTLGDANKGLNRSDQNVLYKAKSGGDKVKIPEKKEKKVDCNADKPAPDPPTYVFQVPTYKMWLRLRILRDDFEPVKQASYELEFDDNGKLNLKTETTAEGKDKTLNVDGKELPLKGKTDDNGLIEHEIPVQLETAVLSVRVKAEDTDEPKPKPEAGDGGEAPAKPKEPQPARGEVPITWKLQIGKLNPIKEKAPDSNCVSGVQQRLNNLNMNSGPVDGKLGRNTKAAIKAFQDLYQIVVPKGSEGKPDKATQEKLYDVHEKPGPVPKPPEPKPAKAS